MCLITIARCIVDRKKSFINQSIGYKRKRERKGAIVCVCYKIEWIEKKIEYNHKKKKPYKENLWFYCSSGFSLGLTRRRGPRDEGAFGLANAALPVLAMASG